MTRAFFTGLDAKGVEGLWETDGTAAGTHEITGYGQTSYGISPNELTVLGRKAVFTANGQLGSTDGTAAETGAFTDIKFGYYYSGRLFAPLNPSGLTVYGDEIVFLAAVDAYGDFGWWTTDGTPNGTREIGFDLGSDLTAFGKELLFDGSDQGLWATDGT